MFDSAFWNWFVGLIEGESTFGVHWFFVRRKGFYPRVIPIFQLNFVREDAQVLPLIKEALKTLGINAYVSPFVTPKGCSPRRILKVQGVDGCVILKDFISTFKLHLNSRKRQFKVWSEIVDYLAKRHGKRQGFTKEQLLWVAQKNDELRETKSKKGKRKWTYSKIKAELEEIGFNR